jgi:hypothetical protein
VRVYFYTIILTYNLFSRNASRTGDRWLTPHIFRSTINTIVRNLRNSHLISTIDLRLWVSARQLHETSGSIAPDKREVVSSILTRPISNLLSRKHLRTAPRGAVLSFAVDCDRSVSKNYGRFACFLAGSVFLCHVMSYQIATYGTSLERRKLREVCINCEQKFSRPVSGRSGGENCP